MTPFESKVEKKFDKVFPWLLVIFSIIAFYMSFALATDKYRILADPSFVPSCSVNPLLSCGDVMSTPQASVFGFPNPLLGVIGFMITLTTAMAMLAGAKMKKWFWRCFYVGILFAITFIHWLYHEAVFEIEILCPNCMVVWASVAPIFYYTLMHGLFKKNFFKSSKSVKAAKFLWSYQFLFLGLWYVLLFGSIIFKFRDKFSLFFEMSF